MADVVFVAEGTVVLWFGLVVLSVATAGLLATAAPVPRRAGGPGGHRRPAPTLVALACAGAALTLEGMRQPRESMLFGGLLVVLAFAGLMVASLSMAVGPHGATWIPGRRGAAACTLGGLVVMALGFAIVPAAAR